MFLSHWESRIKQLWVAGQSTFREEELYQQEDDSWGKGGQGVHPGTLGTPRPSRWNMHIFLVPFIVEGL